jgi:hypothetical protein
MKQKRIEDQAAMVFLKAASYIRKYGWRKEGMSKHGQPRCSMGALASAHSRQQWNKNLSVLMYKALYEELSGLSLTQFNCKYQSGEKVAELYERVAEKLRHNQFSQGNFA